MDRNKLMEALPRKSSNNTLRKAKGFPSITNIWNNSIYSFNKNFLKNLPAVDNIVNKLIKSFFTINALSNNPKGKKKKLVQRRYLRLSLNKILVSKSEIKHTNDKVFVTVYLFNKKRKSLLLGLKNIYNTFANDKLASKANITRNLSNSINSKYTNENREIVNLTKKTNNRVKFYKNVVHLTKSSSASKFISSYDILNNKSNNTTILNNIIANKYATQGLVQVNSGVKFLTNSYIDSISTDNKFYDFYKKNFDRFIQYASRKRYQIYNNRFANKYKVLSGLMTKSIGSKDTNLASKTLNNALLFLKGKGAKNNLLPIRKLSYKNNNKGQLYSNILYYYKLRNLTQYNIQKFVTSKSQLSNNSLEARPQKNNNTILLNTELNSKPLPIIAFANNKLDISSPSIINLKDLSKQVSKYKLYNSLLADPNKNLTIDMHNSNYKNNIVNSLLKPNYSIYKLKSMYKLFAKYNNTSNIMSIENGMYTKKVLKNTHLLLKRSNTLNIELKNSTIKNKVLINKLNNIELFFDKYSNIFSGRLEQSSNSFFAAKGIPVSYKNSIISSYKINFINEILEKELLYISYLKLLSYNQAIFKNWFTYSLRNLISKIYNKKVVLNLINLKYIHLNSDILTQAVDIRLKNFKRNRVVKVLKKVIKLVPISKINIYACDEHSPIYKYVTNHNNKFMKLKFDIFKDLNLLTSGEPLKNDNSEATIGLSSKGKYSPCKIKRLNHEQASTINFIKYKAAFGVRFEAAGRLTKRSTASRSLFKFKYKGSLRNNPNVILNNSDTAVRIKNNQISNLQFTKIASKTRNGSFGLKGWINNN